MTAEEEVEAVNTGESILLRCDPKEPVFILRGKDIFAHALVRAWAQQLEQFAPLAQDEQGALRKMREAHEIAERMHNWPIHKVPD